MTAGAILVALGVVLLALGAFIEVLDLSMAAIASLCVVFAVIELGGKYPYLIYCGISLLSLLLLPVKTPAIFFAFFAGYYPIVKALLERRVSRLTAWILKIMIFEAALVLLLLLSVKLFLLFEVQWQPWYWAVFPAGAAVFVLYDVALTRLITAYVYRLRHRFRFLHDD